MKRFFAIALAAIFVICACAVGVFAYEGSENVNLGGSGTIASYSGMDFSSVNNVWAVLDSDKWSTQNRCILLFTNGEDEHYVFYDDENFLYEIVYESDPWYAEAQAIVANGGEVFDLINNKWMEGYVDIMETPMISANFKSYIKYLDWSLSDDGEYITLKSTTNSSDSKASPGIGFEIAQDGERITLGRESDGKPEYMAIRIRNRSLASNFSIAWATRSTGGGDKLVNRVFTDYNGNDYQTNSNEWVTYIFSVADANGEMGYENNPGGAWNSTISHLGIFPFGYDKTDNTGAYKGAELDIDYIVFGSYEFCSNYKSALQQKEENVASIEVVSLPTQKTFYVGETPNLDGLVLNVTNTDGSKKTVTASDIDPNNVVYNNTEESDSSVVTIKYGINTSPITYLVEYIGIDSVEITSPAKNTTLNVSDLTSGLTKEAIDGLEVTIHYKDGKTKTEAPALDKVSISSMSAGQRQIKITYYDKSASYDVFVINVEQITIGEVKTQLHYGEELRLSDIEINCVYNDESKSVKSLAAAGLTNYVESIKVDTSKAGEATVYVHVVNNVLGIDLTGEGKVTVLAPDKLVVKTLPTATTYDPDETIDLTGIELAYQYSDGTEATLNIENNKTTLLIDGVTIVPDYDFGSSGKTDVTLTVNGYKASYEVEVSNVISSRSTTSGGNSGKSGGCGSVIGIGAIAVIVCAAGAGVALFKKKEN